MAHVLWRRRWSVVLSVAAWMLAAGVYLGRATPIYQSTARVLLEQNGPRVSSDSQNSQAQSESYLQTEADAMQSSVVLNRALNAVQFRSMQTFRSIVGDPVDWLRRSGLMKVDVSRKSDVISVSMDSPYPSEAAAFANAVVAAYVAELAQQKKSVGKEMVRVLGEEHDFLAKRRDGCVAKMAALKKEHHVVSLQDDARANPVLAKTAAISASLTGAEIATIEIKAQYDSITAALADPATLATFVESQQFKVKESGDHEYDELRSQLGQASLALDTGMKTQGPNHPRVVALQSVVESLRKRIADKERAMAGAQLLDLSTQLSAAQAKERDLLSLMLSQSNQVMNLDHAILEYAQLDVDLQQVQKQLDTIDSRVAEVLVNTVASRPLNVRTIDPARAEDRPVKPSRTLILAAALLLGAMMGMGIALVREHRDARFHDSQEILSRLGIPVVSTVPHVSPRLSPVSRGQLVWLDPQSAAAEAYRTVRTSIHLGVVGEAKTVLVASPASGDGKSTTASNLAIAFAQAGERVLVLDCDLREPVQHLIFEVDNSQGLTTAMSGESKLSDAIRPTRVPGLHVLPCGPVPANPSEMLASKSFSRLMQALTQTFDRIVIDSPPLMRFTDGSILAASAHVTLMVLRLHQSMGRLSELALERLAHVGARVLGTVANGAPSDDGAYYGRSWQYAQHSLGQLRGPSWSPPESETPNKSIVRAVPTPPDKSLNDLPERTEAREVMSEVLSTAEQDFSTESG
jgi:capsular exopolysaccharide synthesis family protein